MNRSPLALLALSFAGASVGCAWTSNIALYRLWTLIPPTVFPEYQTTHALHFVPVAAIIGIPNALLALLVARRSSSTTGRWLLWVGALLALVPWIATPLYFVPLQDQLRVSGPTTALVSQLVRADLVLRTVPPTIQLSIVLWAALQTPQHTRTFRHS